MKALFATAALVVVVSTGSPATAQVYGDRWDNDALGAFAQAQPSFTVQPRRTLPRAQRTTDGRVHSPNPAYDVYDTSNQYISSDPDAFIRNDLARNPPGRGDD
jgi:hypothetical protein